MTAAAVARAGAGTGTGAGVEVEVGGPAVAVRTAFHGWAREMEHGVRTSPRMHWACSLLESGRREGWCMVSMYSGAEEGGIGLRKRRPSHYWRMGRDRLGPLGAAEVVSSS